MQQYFTMWTFSLKDLLPIKHHQKYCPKQSNKHENTNKNQQQK